MTGLRNLILFYQERDGDRRRLVPDQGSGRYGVLGAVENRHRPMLYASVKSMGSGLVRVVKVSGRSESWERVPEPGDFLVGRVGAEWSTWVKFRVAAVQPWDHGRTLELLVELLEEAEAGSPARSGVARVGGDTQFGPRRTVVIQAASAVMALCAWGTLAWAARGAPAMADQVQSGDSTFLPLEEMQTYLRRMAALPDDLRRQALPEAAEAVLSEAQVHAPRLTGFLSDSHVVLQDETDQAGGEIVIGVNTAYALAVHETHRTKKRWFTRNVVEHFPRVMGQLLVRLTRERGAR